MHLIRNGRRRLSLSVTNYPDYDVARRVAEAVLRTFRGRRGNSLVDVDGSSYLDVVIAGATVVVGVHSAYGIDVFAVDEEADGVILDVANYLMANGDKLGIETNGTA
jgi:hypothetical protein